MKREKPVTEGTEDHGEANACPEVAIIGMAFSLPDASTADAFWDNLVAGRCSIREAPADRWNWADHHSQQRGVDNRGASKWGGFLKSIDRFDAPFFRITPAEAELMDPQQRLLLELAWACFEDAGHRAQEYSGTRTGVYVATSGYDHRERLEKGLPEISSHFITGVQPSLTANRISYFFNLHGPSMPIDTACSGSLVALHEAIHAIQRGDCDGALVGGVSLLSTPTTFVSLYKAGMLSEDGACRSFDAGANGYVRGEGAGFVLLKPLAEALHDGDRILAVVKGTAVNHGGQAGALTSPNAIAQSQVVTRAHLMANVPPDTVGYIEAHGTGTPKGDPIEILGLRRAFAELARRRKLPSPAGSCLIGSVKTNIGHLEAAAGIAGLIKTLLCFQHATIPPLSNFQQPNPRLHLEGSPFVLATRAIPWNRLRDAGGSEIPRRAGVSSFGFGGVNAHVVLEEFATVQQEQMRGTRPAVVVLSARNEARLQEQAGLLLQALAGKTERDLDAIAYTLQVGRENMEFRLACVVDSLEQLREGLKAHLQGRCGEGLYRGEAGRDQKARVAMGDEAQLQAVVDTWFKSGESSRAAQLWAQGFNVDWAPLWAGVEPRRIALPTYPFARERHWAAAQSATTRPQLEVGRTPEGLLCYSTRFNGEEPWLRADSQQGGRAMTVSDQLEMALQAVSHAGGVSCADIRLECATFAAPLVWRGPLLEVHVVLKPLLDGAVDWSICSGEHGRQVPHCEGRVAQAVSSPRYGEGGALASPASHLLAPPPAQTALLKPVWRLLGQEGESAQTWGLRQVVLCGEVLPHVADGQQGVSVVRLKADGEPGQRYAQYARQLQEMLRGLLQAQRETAVLVQLAVPADGPECCAGLSGMLRCAMEESALLLGQVVRVPASMDGQALEQWLQAEAHSGEWQVRQGPQGREGWELQALKGEQSAAALARDGGIYLITGGGGGLGLLLAQAIASQAKNVVLVLLGRSALAASGLQVVRQLEAGGARVEYRRVDVSDAQAVQEMVEEIRTDYGEFSGVIHAAGVLRDSLLCNKTEQELRQVLAPKVQGLVNLDEATRDMRLENFVVFSSLAAVLGNAGQADYAAANGFMDEYMQRRAQQGQRHGRSLSVNWPLWEQGGMQVDAAGRERLWRASGLVPLQTQDALLALGRALSGDQVQMVVFAGDPARIPDGRTAAAVPAGVVPSFTRDAMPAGLQERTTARLRQLFAGIAKLAPDTIDVDEQLEAYGIDSIFVAQANGQLQNAFPGLSKTVLYEYRSLAELAQYLLSEYRDACAGWVGMASVDPIAPALQKAAPVSADLLRRSARSLPPAMPRVEGAIAIIGLSGRYPQAPTLGAFWNKLSSATDCIGEVPLQRWGVTRLEDFYAGESGRNVPGKSYSKWGAFLEGFDEFDPLFFGMSPREALGIDPQERIFLQCVHAALEDAGYTRERIRQQHARRVGVFAGITTTGFEAHGHALEATGFQPRTSFSSLANRVSYLMDFTGPSMPIDTMCSSSLTALHEACSHLRAGECELAVAGGVNLYLHPSSYLTRTALQMMASDGRCRSFGEGGDGYVPGEGVGAVLLKPLERAVADGDRIYGVIKGSAINHGGKTNGYTVPNPNAQAQVIAQALQESGVQAREISYVEAHGTGTALGDPIEIAGLSKAYGQQTQERQYCAIGSAKSNIGHCESAAGIAGLTKVLLQMQHGMLVKSLHSEKLNPNIDFGQTPFVVQQENAQWKRPVIDGREVLRTAGISSFGAGGSNAHVIVQEYVQPQQLQERELPAGPVVVVVSARNEERLREQVSNLVGALQDQGQQTQQDLQDIAYTLQVGREAMESRLACVVESVQELGEKLQGWLKGRTGQGCYQGEVQRGREGLGVLAGDEDARELVEKWLAKGKAGKLAELWVRGLEVDWQRLWSGVKPRRIALPTYPFARERYWLPQAAVAALPPSAGHVLHPLLHANTSDLGETRYTSRLVGDEFFLRDHVVQGQRVLPGVAQLEMAWQAVQRASGQEHAAVELQDVVFAAPVVVGEHEVELHIGLQLQEDGSVSWEIYSGEQGQEQVYSQGRAVLQETAGVGLGTEDLSLLEAQCNRWLDARECYGLFAGMGLEYGPALQGLQSLGMGRDEAGSAVVLGRVQLPQAAQTVVGEYRMNPGLLDAGLQAAIGMVLQEKGSESRTLVPFALHRLQVHGVVPQEVTAVIRRSAGSHADAALVRLDVQLVDAHGNVCVRLAGFTTRPLQAALPPPAQTALLKPVWRLLGQEGESAQTWGLRQVVLCGEVLPHVADGQQGVSVVRLKADGEPGQRYAQYARQLQEMLRGLLQAQRETAVLVQLAVPADGPECCAGLSGMLRCAMEESALLLGQVVRVPASMDGQALEQWLQAEAHSGEWQVRQGPQGREGWELQALKGEQSAAALARDGGIYLITGGGGGLGLLLAQAIASQAKNVVLVLLGRSALAASGLQVVRQLEAGGARVEYRRVDVSDAQAVQEMVEEIRTDYGEFSGVIHAAGVLRDSLLCNKTEQELRQVLAPKVQGLVNLDEATRDMRLENFVVFSSLAAVLGNAGQADYAAANGFMDEYMQRRAQQGQRHGRSLSVNWPLWEQGGMQVDAAGRERLWRASGLVPLQTQDALLALGRALSGDQVQMVVFAGDPARIPDGRTPLRCRSEQKLPLADNRDLRERTEGFLVQLLAERLHVPPARLAVHAPLEDYGIDSIRVMELTRALEDHFGPMRKTLFFEYQTIHALAGYFLQEHGELLTGKLETGSELQTREHVASGRAPAATTNSRRHRPRRAMPPMRALLAAPPLDIAIVGINGRYPQAENLVEYWSNLTQGRDCISEISPERWDHARYFDPGNRKGGGVYSKWGGFLESVDRFDPLFFNISPHEAQRMDPQERLFLETVYATLQDAGYPRAKLVQSEADKGGAANVGVFVGVMYEEYQLYGAQAQLADASVAVSGNPSSIANRVSYWCNFRGPSMAVDTMCSSSLTAIHLACESLARGRCEAAIAGGVNVSIHPNKYLVLSQAQFASSDGRCRSFGEGGDGYVPGEGVGAVLLKPLERAVADGDRIYGVIKGSAINHGGKTNGYTVPNPNAQAQVIAQALQESGVQAREISYVEAHGTGTALGDPIEIAGLSKAYGQQTQERQYCAIGSAKSNIGHCESAAGIAGLTKVLLQMQHGMLVKSLHSEKLNPNIDFGQTPFVVQQENAQWKRPVIDGREVLRTAGISSFGAGGSNAHVIVQEYVQPQQLQERELPAGPVVVVVSARNEERLREQVSNLVGALQDQGQQTQQDLQDIAYTLQVGREAMESRLACVVESVQELGEKLQGWLKGRTGQGCYQGEVQRGREGLGVLAGDEDARELVEKWLAKGKAGKLAELWVRGLEVDWQRLWSGVKPRRIALPTYPFARERYWLPQAAVAALPPSAGHVLHPLLHANTSDLGETRYTSRLVGDEFFLRDHVVQGQRVLPGVAQLEMAWQAVQRASGQEHAAVELQDVVFAAPVVVGEHEVELHIGLQLQEDGSVSWEIYSGEQGQEQVYSQGRAVLQETAGVGLGTEDLSLLEAQCNRWLDARECYGLFAGMGLEYGPALQGLQSLGMGRDEAGSAVVLGRVQLPQAAQTVVGEYRMNPGLLDAGLQAAIGMVLQEKGSESRTLVPFALHRLQVHGVVPQEVTAVIRRSAGSHADAALVRLDVQLVDAHGNVCVRLAGFTTRPLQAALPPPAEEAAPHPRQDGMLCADEKGSLQPSPVVASGLEEVSTPAFDAALRSRTVEFLRSRVGPLLDMPAESLDPTELLSSYGIDSILVLRVTNDLREQLGNLDATLLFEHGTIAALSEHLLQTKRDELIATLGQRVNSASETSVPKSDALHAPARAASRPLQKMGRARASSTSHQSRPIAIIGLSGRYPAASDLREFWRRLQDGDNCTREIPPERWRWQAYHGNKGQEGQIYSRWGGFVDGVDAFDPLFFNLSPREAERMDPQERLFLQEAYACIGDAGYTPAGLCTSRKVGVFVGTMNATYGPQPTQWSVANRVSFLLGFTGPSMAVDTACSSSLTALHLACRSLQAGETECSIVGGVNLILRPVQYQVLSEMTMLSSGGECRSFGADADGFVDAEGVGAVLLKPLERAVADGDRIYGVIKGSAINHGGKTNGYTVPNPNAQAQVIAQALQESGVQAREISYVEAHGTGTALGDPIEIAGLSKAYGQQTQERQYCAIGSAKSNIGHCESAAGIAGLTKVLLQMQHGMLVKSLHSEKLNPNIDFGQTPFVVQQENAQWKRPVIDGREVLRTAGISSFGAGGSNAHVIVQEYVQPQQLQERELPAGPVVVVVSARNEERLREQVSNLVGALQDQGQQTQQDLQDIAYTLQVGREAMESRLACVVESVQQLQDKLQDWLKGESPGGLYRGDVKRSREAMALFGGSEEVHMPSGNRTSISELNGLALLWVKGQPVEWQHLWAGVQPRRIGLPTYAFARNRYWLPQAWDGGEGGVVRPEPGRLSPRSFESLLWKLEQQLISVEDAVQEAANSVAGDAEPSGISN